MKLLRFNRCRGLRLLRWRFWQIELWYCPRAEQIPAHRHPHMDGRILWLGGHMMFVRNGEGIELRLRDTCKGFYVEHEDWHAARVMGRFGIFAVIEHWLLPPTSAAFDIVYDT